MAPHRALRPEVALQQAWLELPPALAARVWPEQRLSLERALFWERALPWARALLSRQAWRVRARREPRLRQ